LKAADLPPLPLSNLNLNLTKNCLGPILEIEETTILVFHLL